MAAGKSSRINRQYKTKYRIRNWREYERGLRSRGDVTIWLSEDAIAAWIPPKNGLRGGQRRYSNLAIRTALTLRVVFGLPLRQTEGFLDSLLSLMSRDLKAPDHPCAPEPNRCGAAPDPSPRPPGSGRGPRPRAPCLRIPGLGSSTWTGAGRSWRSMTAPAASCDLARGCRPGMECCERGSRPISAVLNGSWPGRCQPPGPSRSAGRCCWPARPELRRS